MIVIKMLFQCDCIFFVLLLAFVLFVYEIKSKLSMKGINHHLKCFCDDLHQYFFHKRRSIFLKHDTSSTGPQPYDAFIILLKQPIIIFTMKQFKDFAKRPASKSRFTKKICNRKPAGHFKTQDIFTKYVILLVIRH